MTDKLLVPRWDGTLQPWTYEGTFRRQTTTGPLRLVIGAARKAVELMWDLVSTLPPPYGVLYVLLKPIAGAAPGRYQSPPLERLEVLTCLARYRSFFEGDGRHHVWLSSPGQGHVVYDQHDVLYAYGAIEHFEDILQRSGLRAGEVEFPGEHAHAYHHEYDTVQTALLGEFNWTASPLRSEDIWD
jgi:hypothetical protein